VDEVVMGAPWIVTNDLITSLNISLVVQGTIGKEDQDYKKQRKMSLEISTPEDPYQIPKMLGIYREIKSERPIDTKIIIQRIIDNRLRFMTKYERTLTKEENYYSNLKTYVQET
jgi:ethanolamine-phosphate cytidylyltransferase